MLATRRQDFQELKAVLRPPPPVAAIAQAAKILVSIEDFQPGACAETGMTFGSAETVALVCWRDPSMSKKLIEVVLEREGGIGEEKLGRIGDLFESYYIEDSTGEVRKGAYALLNDAKKASPAAAAVGGWIWAVVEFCRAAGETGVGVGPGEGQVKIPRLQGADEGSMFAL